MDLEEKWQRTLEETKIVKFYHPHLASQEATDLPYIFIGASVVNVGDTVIRKGRVIVDRPMIVLPQNMPQFSGFEFEEYGADAKDMQLFFMVRGINFPSLKYKHESSDIEVVSKEPEAVLDQYRNDLEKEEDFTTGLVYGPVECWQLSILVYIGMLINRSAAKDVERYLNELRKKFTRPE